MRGFGEAFLKMICILIAVIIIPSLGGALYAYYAFNSLWESIGVFFGIASTIVISAFIYDKIQNRIRRKKEIKQYNEEFRKNNLTKSDG